MSSNGACEMSEPVEAATPAPAEGPALKKNKVPLADVLNILWKSEGKPEDSVWTWINLSRPADEEECPITQDPMHASELDFLPGVAFRKDDPEYSRILLKCGHAFSAMSITYHFFKNSMMCPLCRKGHDKKLAPVCVPVHFRRQMQERLVIERAKERVEADRENLASAMLTAEQPYWPIMGFIANQNEMQGHTVIIEQWRQDRSVGFRGFVVDQNALLNAILGRTRNEERLSVFLGNHRMCMIVYAYETGDDLAPAAVTELPADVWSLPAHATDPTETQGRIPYETTRIRRGEGAGPDPASSVLVISMPRSSLRELGRNLRGLQHPLRYRFVVGTRSLSGGVVEISRSELVDFAAPGAVRGAFGGIYVQSNTEGLGFDVRHLEAPTPDTGALESVVWSIAEPEFVDFALACIFRAQQTHEMMAVPPPMSQPALEVD